MNQCAQCASQSDLRRCSGCLEVWYCSKDCQRQHWGQHKRTCKSRKAGTKTDKKTGKAKQTDAGKPAHDSGPATSHRTEGASASGGAKSKASAGGGMWLCMNCGKRGVGMETCDRCHLQTQVLKANTPGESLFPNTFVDFQTGQMIFNRDSAGGPIHGTTNIAQRKVKAENRTREERNLAEQRRENCRPSSQQDGAEVTPFLTWEEARSRATLLFPRKQILDKFKDLSNDILSVPPCENVVSISRISGNYELASEFRVARRLKDAEEKGSFVIFHISEDPMPFFRYEHLSVGNFLCLDHAHLHKFMDGTMGFRVDYPWDVLILRP